VPNPPPLDDETFLHLRIAIPNGPTRIGHHESPTEAAANAIPNAEVGAFDYYEFNINPALHAYLCCGSQFRDRICSRL